MGQGTDRRGFVIGYFSFFPLNSGILLIKVLSQGKITCGRNYHDNQTRFKEHPTALERKHSGQSY
jgi:hypothetical protein